VVLVTFVLGGISAGAAIHDSPYLPAFYAFTLPAVTPAITALLTRGSGIPVGMGLMLLLFIGVLFLLARTNHRRIADYIRIRLADAARGDELHKLTVSLTEQVAERQKFAAALDESSARFRAISDNAVDAIIISDAGGNVVFWNPAAERMFGYLPDEIMGRNIHKILAPARFREEGDRNFARFVSTGEGNLLGKTVSLSALRKDGTEFPIDISLSAINLGGARNALGLIRDTTEREKAVADLRERSAELEEAQRVAHVGNWTYDPRTSVAEWSEEIYRIFGCDPSQPAPGPAEYANLLVPASIALMTASLQACASSGEPFEINLEILKAGGKTGWVSLRGEAHQPATGLMHLRGTIQDITARVQAEERVRDEEAMFRGLVEQNMSGTFIVSEDSTITYVNPRGVDMLGADRDDAVIGRRVLDFVDAPFKAAVVATMEALLKGGQTTAELPLRLRKINGELLAVLAQSVPAIYRREHVIFTVLVDMSEQQRAQDEIAKLNEQLATTVDTQRRQGADQAAIARLSDVLQSCRTTSEAYPIVAAAAGRLFPKMSGVFARLDSGTRQVFRTAQWGPDPRCLPVFATDDCWALRTGEPFEVDGPDAVPQCQHFSAPPPGQSLCLPLSVRGETRGLLHLESAPGVAFDDDMRRLAQSFGDVVKLSLSNLNLRDTLAEQALRDPLTGLFNRRYLDEALPREISRAQRGRTQLTVAMLDIDHFKRFNDEHGHDAGDLVLSEIGALLRDDVRGGDIACRYGGEEFVIVLPECDLSAALVRLTQIADAAKRKTLQFLGVTLPRVTLSIGVAGFGPFLPDADRLITAADKAMYLAKGNGRDRIEVFRSQQPQSVVEVPKRSTLPADTFELT
jgi:diguanylate cyclase (GGDEF)-like protein/PAS domain S-box-containing protein